MWSVCETHLQFTRETVVIEGKHTSAHANPQQQKMHAAVFVSVDTGAESLPEMEGGKMYRGKDREKVWERWRQRYEAERREASKRSWRAPCHLTKIIAGPISQGSLKPAYYLLALWLSDAGSSTPWQKTSVCLCLSPTRTPNTRTNNKHAHKRSIHPALYIIYDLCTCTPQGIYRLYEVIGVQVFNTSLPAL